MGLTVQGAALVFVTCRNGDRFPQAIGRQRPDFRFVVDCTLLFYIKLFFGIIILKIKNKIKKKELKMDLSEEGDEKAG